MDAVNLLPPEYVARSRKRGTPADSLDARRTLRIGGAAALALAVLMAGLYVHERSVVSSKRSALEKSQARLAAVQVQVQAVKEAEASAQARLAVVQSVTATRMNWDRALNDFARIMPTDSFLTSLQVSAPTPTASVAAAPTTTTSTSSSTTTATAPVPTTSTLTIGGAAPSTVGVARVMDRIALIPWLSGITLGSASRAADGSSSFTLSATVSQEP